MAGLLDVLAVEEDLAGVGGLQQVDAAQESGLAAAGGSDDADYLALGGGKINILEHHVVAKGLLEMADVNNRTGHYSTPPSVTTPPEGCDFMTTVPCLPPTP